MTKKRTLKTYLTIAFLLIWTPLCALADERCRTRAEALAYLSQEPVFQLVATGVSDMHEGLRLEVWGGVTVDEYLVLQVASDGTSCLIDYGYGWLGRVGKTGPPDPPA